MKAQKVGTTMEGGEVEGIKYQLTEENPTFFYKRKKLTGKPTTSSKYNKHQQQHQKRCRAIVKEEEEECGCVYQNCCVEQFR